jgi:hypothetical protein
MRAVFLPDYGSHKTNNKKNYSSKKRRHGGRSNNLGVPEVMWWKKSTYPLGPPPG